MNSGLHRGEAGPGRGFSPLPSPRHLAQPPIAQNVPGPCLAVLWIKSTQIYRHSFEARETKHAIKLFYIYYIPFFCSSFILFMAEFIKDFILLTSSEVFCLSLLSYLHRTLGPAALADPTGGLSYGCAHPGFGLQLVGALRGWVSAQIRAPWPSEDRLSHFLCR